jgi:hypothetical protein
MTNSSSFTSTEEEQQKQKFGAAILYAAEYKEFQRIIYQEVVEVEFSNLLANFFLYQVTNMSRRLYFCLCYTKPRRSLISNI